VVENLSSASGAIPALALAHRSSAVNGQMKSTTSIATHQITTGMRATRWFSAIEG
jgi:hypothetical protein